MVLGYTLLSIALIATVAANVLFTLARRNKEAHLARWGKFAAVLASGAVVASSGYLSYLIYTHQFQFTYVAEYSAKRSSPNYLFAAFWGGQEGSILLWTLWTSILGGILAFRGRGQESRVWPIFGVVQVFLLGLLLVKCPFAVGAGPVPPDGKGLNPLLENPWMVIHPPILFCGFASLVIPFAWAVYGLVYRDWDGWIKYAFPWALFSFTVLGFGIALGGYWAYETLGWGGFWGWDPVENSSLIPWLVLTALLHGIAIQRANGGYKATNLVLGYTPLALMFYGTFLTRTGLLDDFSVHSFSSLGKDGFIILLTGVILAFTIPTILLLFRLRSIPRPAAYEKIATREFGYFIASATLGIIGVITLGGVSAPLITKLWMKKGAGATPEFYNQGLYPLAILLALGMATTPYLAWRATKTDDVMKRLFPAYAAAIALTLVMLLMGGRNPLMLLLFATSLFAVITNLLLIVPRIKRRESRATIGGFVAHMGAGLLLLGVASLVTFSQTAQAVQLIRGAHVRVLGYTLTYEGMSSQPFDREHNHIQIRVEKNGRVWHATPRYYIAPWENKDTPFANPPAIIPNLYQIHNIGELFFWNHPLPGGDLYIAHSSGPTSLAPDDMPNPNKGFDLKVKQKLTVGDYEFMFFGLDTAEAQQIVQATENDKNAPMPPIFIKALVAVSYRGAKAVFTEPRIQIDPKGGVYSLPANIPGPDGRNVALQLIPPTVEEEQSKEPLRVAHFATYNAPDPMEAVYMDVSTKPLIWLVWVGTVLYTIGGFIAYRRRAFENGLLGTIDSAPVSETPSPTAAPAPAPTPRREVKRRRVRTQTSRTATRPRQ